MPWSKSYSLMGQDVFGFSRCQGYRTAIEAVPRLIGGLLAGTHDAPLGEAVWQGTPLLVPESDCHWDWRNVLTDEPVIFAANSSQSTLALAELLVAAGGFRSCAVSQSPHQGWQQEHQ